MMDKRRQEEASVWSRLKRNAAENRGMFKEAGIADDNVQTVQCTACGCEEKAYFWSVKQRKGSTLHLHCPRCDQGGVRYGLANNRVAHPSVLRSRAALGYGSLLLLVIAAVIYLGDAAFIQQSPIFRAGAEIVAGTVPGTWLGSEEAEESPRAATGETPKYYAFIAQGDRREEVARYVEEMSSRYGPGAASAVLEILYRADDDRTQVVVSTSAVEWYDFMMGQEGWELVPVWDEAPE